MVESFKILFSSFRVEVDWDLSSYGRREMVEEIMTAAIVMAMLLVPIPSRLALSVRKITNRGTWRCARQHSPLPIAVEIHLRNKL